MNRATKLTLVVALPVAALAAAGQSASAAPPSTEPPGAEPGNAVPADFVTLVDDTETITVAVPISWADVDTALFDGFVPQIEAAPDRHAYIETFDVPGVTFRAVSFTPDTETLTLNFGLVSGCADEEVAAYDDGVFAGTQRTYSGCGKQRLAEFHVIAANPDNQAFTALLIIQITGPDEASIVDVILSTFNTNQRPTRCNHHRHDRAVERDTRCVPTIVRRRPDGLDKARG